MRLPLPERLAAGRCDRSIRVTDTRDGDVVNERIDDPLASARALDYRRPSRSRARRFRIPQCFEYLRLPVRHDGGTRIDSSDPVQRRPVTGKPQMETRS